MPRQVMQRRDTKRQRLDIKELDIRDIIGRRHEATRGPLGIRMDSIPLVPFIIFFIPVGSSPKNL
jgi:hypothetical protein